VDANTALEPALAHRLPPAGDDPALPADPRWRLRGPGARAAETREHVELPLDATDAESPQRAPRDAELWLLARRTHGAALRLDFELRSALVRQLFRRDFVYVSRQLHALEASRRVQGLDRAALNDALAALQNRADDVQALLRRIAADLQSAIDARAPANARLAFARPARFQATIVSPGAHRFLALLTQADETLARLEMAWLLGLVDPATRTALASDCRRALHGFKDLASDRRHAVGELVREVNALRREGREVDRPA
jgi:septal ring factor EnvC (AmiA/AmiB activator)